MNFYLLSTRPAQLNFGFFPARSLHWAKSLVQEGITNPLPTTTFSTAPQTRNPINSRQPSSPVEEKTVL